MKIDKANPRHWFYLFVFATNVLAGVLCRWAVRDQQRRLVLYGHKFNGNLKALYRYLEKQKLEGFEVSFLVVDPVYHRQLEKAGVNVLSGLNLKDAVSVCRSACVVSDHGPHALYFLKKLTKVKFIDVWHGIPFKGFDQADFHWLHGYTATFVTSPSMKVMYEKRFGFTREQVKVTGYARTDALVNNEYDRQEILCDLGISEANKKLVLFAPTWNHGSKAHSHIPFDMAPAEFFGGVSQIAVRSDFYIVFRTHLNTAAGEYEGLPNVKFVPPSTYPDTEALLYISDVLVSDWSSIVFDFLVLRRPTIFIDTEVPFSKGFSYGPEYRFGPIVSDFEQLGQNIIRGCERPEEILRAYGDHMRRVTAEVYSGYADGSAAKRCIGEIARLINIPRTSHSLHG